MKRRLKMEKCDFFAFFWVNYDTLLKQEIAHIFSKMPTEYRV